MMGHPGRIRGATLTEVIITTGIFSLLVLALFAVMKYGVRSWRNIESKSAVQSQLRKIELFLLEDLKRSSFDELRVESMPSGYTPGNNDSLNGKTAHGPAVWFLSALDSERQNFLRDPDGKPDWQRNVLYYVTRPTDEWHRAKFGEPCKTSDQYDAYCPHKWLIRKEIAQDTLLDETAITTYLTRPGSYDLLDAWKPSQPDLERVQVLSDSLLVFRVTLKKPEVLVDLKAFRLLEAGDILHVGSSSLDNNVFTVQYDARVVPNN